MLKILSGLFVANLFISFVGASSCFAGPRGLEGEKIFMDVACQVDGQLVAGAAFRLTPSVDYPGVFTNLNKPSTFMIGDVSMSVTGAVERPSRKQFSLCLASFQAVKATTNPPAIVWTVSGELNQILRDFRSGEQPQPCLPIPDGSTVRVNAYATEAGAHGAYCDFSFRIG